MVCPLGTPTVVRAEVMSLMGEVISFPLVLSTKIVTPSPLKALFSATTSITMFSSGTDSRSHREDNPGGILHHNRVGRVIGPPNVIPLTIGTCWPT